MKKALFWFLGAAALAGLLWFKTQFLQDPSWEQTTMGTTCHITLAGSVRRSGLAALRRQTDAALEEVNDRMSVWNPQTEISAFNALESTNPIPVSPEFSEVVQSALAYAQQTGGAFDPTVKPLVDYWGFGPAVARKPLEQIMRAVGWKKVQLNDGMLSKTTPELQLDLAAIAKGYGVDCVADVIRKSGHDNFLVEIGGEIVASGSAPSRRPWRVGIESPNPDKAFGEDIFQVLELSDRAMATSGDYRNFRLRNDGTRYSHIIDPHTGNPAESNVAAVTVLAARCMDADAVATALFVMGSEKGLAWVESNPGVEAFFIVHAPDGTFAVKSSSGFLAVSESRCTANKHK